MSEEFVSKSVDPNINHKDIAELNYIESQKALQEIVERQIQELTDLDHNLFDNDVLSNTILSDVLLYVNDNYITIPGIETIIVDASTLSRVGRYVYELYAVELLNYIIPNVLLSMDLKDPVELTVVSPEGIKSAIHNVALKRLDSIKQLYVSTGSDELYEQILKWTFYLDLFDANLEDFIERVLTVLVNQYNTKLFSKLIPI